MNPRTIKSVYLFGSYIRSKLTIPNWTLQKLPIAQIKKHQIWYFSPEKALLRKITRDAGPEWFQDLSFEQMDLVNDLQRRMLSDLERRSIDEVQEFFQKLGVLPYINGTAIWRALKQSNGDPVRFLFAAQLIVSEREQEEFEKEYPFLEEHRLPRASFSVNERLILSAVFHYHFPMFVEQLDKLLPPRPEKSHVLWGQKKPPKKIQYSSPYLEPQPINELCWYEEKAERDLEKKVLKTLTKTQRGSLYEKEGFSKFAAPLIKQGKRLAEQHLENLLMSEKKKRKKRRQEMMKKSRESVRSKDSWEINCELESMMESQERFFETYSISDKELLEGNNAQKSKETLHSRKLSFVPPNFQFCYNVRMMYEDWPWQYSFPPFFTIQPNHNTQKLQLTAWCELVLKYHKFHNQYVLDLREALGTPLFKNEQLKRSLPVDGVTQVLSHLQSSGNAEPLDKSKNRWYIYWHTLEEWAALIYSWAEDTGQIGAVCTFYEIINTSNQEFFGIDPEVLKKALKLLETQRKAEIIMFEENNGVKFF